MSGVEQEVNKATVLQLLSELKQAQNEWSYYDLVRRSQALQTA